MEENVIHCLLLSRSEEIKADWVKKIDLLIKAPKIGFSDKNDNDSSNSNDPREIPVRKESIPGISVTPPNTSSTILEVSLSKEAPPTSPPPSVTPSSTIPPSLSVSSPEDIEEKHLSLGNRLRTWSSRKIPTFRTFSPPLKSSKVLSTTSSKNLFKTTSSQGQSSVKEKSTETQKSSRSTKQKEEKQN